MESKTLNVQNPDSKAPDLSVFMNYEYDVDVDGDNALAFVIKFVGNNKKVLEIGAGSGMISRKLVELNNCQLTAAEISDTSIAKLKQITRSVYKTDLNKGGWSKDFKREGKYDVVVAADVLEHLYDPWSTLVEMKSLLNDTGEIVISLPHTGHNGILAALYCEDFEYKEWGLLDKTHIRFFGLNNIHALHEKAGLTMTDVKYVTSRLRPQNSHANGQNFPRNFAISLMRTRMAEFIRW
jgi:2-polyprenyl-3-methyl-5-hydroxy-6-metoxy-1,4-benzoquinol methylase